MVGEDERERTGLCNGEEALGICFVMFRARRRFWTQLGSTGVSSSPRNQNPEKNKPMMISRQSNAFHSLASRDDVRFFSNLVT